MSDLSAAAAALGVPEPIVQRSAAARAEATGMSVDEVLAAWAGGGAIGAPSGETAEEPAAPAEDTAPAEEPVAETVPEPAPAPTETTETQGAPAPAQPAAVTRSPVPARVTPAEAAGLPEVVTVPTAGIRERPNFAVPKWLAALFIIIPAFALFALGGSATGTCGEATELAVDVISGEIVNCDGSEFTGSGAGGGGSDFIAMGQALYTGGPNCQGCHGANGQGGAAFPALTGVLTTFGSCADHIEWVALGSGGFTAAGRDSYGDTNKPVNGGMPQFDASLTEEQLAAVAAFERVRFGGGNPDEVLADCGLSEEPEEGGGEGEEPVPGETTTTTEGAPEASGGGAG